MVCVSCECVCVCIFMCVCVCCVYHSKGVICVKSDVVYIHMGGGVCVYGLHSGVWVGSCVWVGYVGRE